MAANSEWIERKLEEQQRLYEKYGKSLEKEHKGKFVAISLEGEIILDRRLGEVLAGAVETFGEDNFALMRVGDEVYGAGERASKESNRRLAEEQERIKDQLAKEKRLYSLHAKHLEPEHNGEFVAISFDGELVVGKRDGEVLKRAVDTFGRGNFAMARVGHEVMHEWVSLW